MTRDWLMPVTAVRSEMESRGEIRHAATYDETLGRSHPPINPQVRRRSALERRADQCHRRHRRHVKRADQLASSIDAAADVTENLAIVAVIMAYEGKSWPGSPLMLVKARTAIEGLSGRARAGFAVARAAASCSPETR
jgi:hypothetical protein